MAAARALTFLVPGDWHTPTGGYQYDRRLAESLAAAGWTLDVRRLDGPWPEPDADTLGRAAATVADIADGSLVLADGLAFGTLGPLVATQAARLRWVALVHHPLHLETGLPQDLRARLLNAERRALQFARQVVVTSARTARDVLAMGVPLTCIAVVEPGTDALPSQGAEGETAALEMARSGAPAPGPAPAAGPVRLLCVATLTPRKGHALLLEALAGLTDLSWELHCVGSPARDPATAARLLAQAEASPLAGRVRWHGEVDAATLQRHYAVADLLVLASLHEGYGMVVAEALAAGIPVLASDAGALAQTLPPEAGWRVPAGDVPALRAALRTLIGDRALRQRLAAGARAAAMRLPSWSAQAERFAAVLAAVP